MISICIPVYNFPIAGLVETLRKMANQLQADVEIIVIDDASDPVFQQQNQHVEMLVDQYHLLPHNVGRSRIRNRFIEYARHEYCLFLDCDVIPAKEDYLSVYAEKLRLSPMVIYGGRIFPKQCPGTQALLRWKYGTEIESKTATHRQIDPYRNFHSNNFLIRKSIMEQVQFDESLTGYGYEDSLFSYQLQNAGIPVLHIDNAILNLQIETTEIYLGNIDQSLYNLAAIQQKYDIGKIVRLVKVYNEYHSLFFFLPTVLRETIRKQLVDGSVNLKMLQLYKLLGYKSALKNKRGAG